MRVLCLLIVFVAFWDQEIASQYPYLVRICQNSSDTCHGVLITRNLVLTAAHCLSGKKEVFVDFASHNKTCTSKMSNASQAVKPSFFIQHEGFGKRKSKNLNDLALIRLPKPVNLTANINLGNLTKKPWTHYKGKSVSMESPYGSGIVKNFTAQIGSHELCNIFDLKGDCGCANTSKPKKFDQNAFPLEYNGVIFGYSTIESLKRSQAFFFVDIYPHLKWINSHLNGGYCNKASGYFVLIFLIQGAFFVFYR